MLYNFCCRDWRRFLVFFWLELVICNFYWWWNEEIFGKFLLFFRPPPLLKFEVNQCPLIILFCLLESTVEGGTASGPSVSLFFYGRLWELAFKWKMMSFPYLNRDTSCTWCQPGYNAFTDAGFFSEMVSMDKLRYANLYVSSFYFQYF